MTAQPSRIPITTLLLIAANMLAAFTALLQPELLDQFAFREDHPSIQTAFTSLFLHQNIIHLLGNMVFLAAVGASVELATGSLRFAIVYFVSGLAGVATHMLLGPASVPLLGASGSVAGCAAYYSARYFGLKVPLAPRVAVPVAAVTGLWLVLQVVGALVHIGGEASAVSYWAHLGGFVSGLLLTVAFRGPDLGQRALGHKVLDEMNQRSPAATIAAAEHHLISHPNDPKALQEIISAAATMDDAHVEVPAILKLLEVTPETNQGPLLRRLGALNHLSDLPALQRTLMAERFKPVDPDLSELLLASVVAEPVDEPQRPDAMLALAGLKMDADPDQAKLILSQLAKSYPLHASVELARVRGWLA